MRRLSLFLGTLSWGSRLQILVGVLMLTFWAWLDIKFGIWPATVAIMIFSGFLGWVIMPLMVRFPQTAYRAWSSFGIVYLGVYLLFHGQWWWKTVAAHFGREILLSLELSTGYWFISELRLKQERSADEDPQDQDESPRLGFRGEV